MRGGAVIYDSTGPFSEKYFNKTLYWNIGYAQQIRLTLFEDKIRMDALQDERQWYAEFERVKDKIPTREDYFNILNTYAYWVDNNAALGGINHLFYDKDKELWGAYYNGWRWLTFDPETCMLPGYTA